MLTKSFHFNFFGEGFISYFRLLELRAKQRFGYERCIVCNILSSLHKYLSIISLEQSFFAPHSPHIYSLSSLLSSAFFRCVCVCVRVLLKAELSLLPFVFCCAPLQANINQQCSDYPAFPSVFYTLHSSVFRHTSTLSVILPFFVGASYSNCLIYVRNKKLPILHHHHHHHLPAAFRSDRFIE